MKYILFPVCLFIAFNTPAQVKTNDVQESGYMRTGSNDNTIFFLPQFYTRFPKHDKDTTWKFECYDSRDSVMNIDTVHNIDEVQYFSLFKSYTDSAHTYKDSNWKDQLMPVSSIIQRYDRTSNNKWISIDYTRNKYTELKEDRNKIIKTDTLTIIDPITGKEESIFYKYYKVSPISN